LRWSLVIILFVIIIVVIVDEVFLAALIAFVLFFLVVLFVGIIGDEVEVDGMRLRDFELRFALGATQDFAFFDFVFIHIDFGGTFRATDHGSTLRTVVFKVGAFESVPATVQRIIYRGI
jgi:hypothetical protein